MKMPGNIRPVTGLRGKGTRHRGNPLAFAMAYLRGRYNGGAFTKTVIDATMCAIIA